MSVLKTFLKIGGWFLLASSVIWLGIGIYSYVHSCSFVRTALRTQGVVIRLDKRHDDTSDTTYHPVIVFRDEHGDSQELSSTSGSYPPSYRVGDKLTVIYAPGHPRNAKIDGFFELWGWAVIGTAVGTFDVIIGVAMLLAPVIIERFRRVPPVIAAT